MKSSASVISQWLEQLRHRVPHQKLAYRVTSESESRRVPLLLLKHRLWRQSG